MYSSIEIFRFQGWLDPGIQMVLLGLIFFSFPPLALHSSGLALFSSTKNGEDWEKNSLGPEGINSSMEERILGLFLGIPWLQRKKMLLCPNTLIINILIKSWGLGLGQIVCFCINDRGQGIIVCALNLNSFQESAREREYHPNLIGKKMDFLCLRTWNGQ